eukprot:scaffold20042_cov32-Tisochrysis_lutea.AAC.4
MPLSLASSRWAVVGDFDSWKMSGLARMLHAASLRKGVVWHVAWRQQSPRSRNSNSNSNSAKNSPDILAVRVEKNLKILGYSSTRSMSMFPCHCYDTALTSIRLAWSDDSLVDVGLRERGACLVACCGWGEGYFGCVLYLARTSSRTPHHTPHALLSHSRST